MFGPRASHLLFTVIVQRAGDGLVCGFLRCGDNKLHRCLLRKFLDDGHLKRFVDVRIAHKPGSVYSLPQTHVLAYLQFSDGSFPDVIVVLIQVL